MNHNYWRRGHYIGPWAAIGARGHDTARKGTSEAEHNQQFDNGFHTRVLHIPSADMKRAWGLQGDVETREIGNSAGVQFSLRSALNAA
jgi:hypothetical protein